MIVSRRPEAASLVSRAGSGSSRRIGSGRQNGLARRPSVQPAERTSDMALNAVLTVDLGATFMRAGVFDRRGKMLAV